jgi:hypothetical protein
MNTKALGYGLQCIELWLPSHWDMINIALGYDLQSNGLEARKHSLRGKKAMLFAGCALINHKNKRE